MTKKLIDQGIKFYEFLFCCSKLLLHLHWGIFWKCSCKRNIKLLPQSTLAPSIEMLKRLRK